MALVDTHGSTDALAGEARVEDYFALLKPRVMSLVVFTALVGMMIAPGGIHPFIGMVAILSIALGAGASGALNMWYDSDVDAIMSRTSNRPIPSGRVSRDEALTFGLILSGFSVFTLGLATNWLAAGLLAFTIFFYAVIYTMWLKRATPQNIVIGGAAGAFPPAIGWAAVTGSVGIEALVMFLIIFLWTPPHFWALALYKRGDYDVAGIPMLPNVVGDRATQNQIFVYSLILVAVSALPVLTGFAGAIYGAVALVTGLGFIVLAWRLYRASEAHLHRLARQLFTYSLSYLFVVFLALFTDRVFALLGGF